MSIFSELKKFSGKAVKELTRGGILDKDGLFGDVFGQDAPEPDPLPIPDPPIVQGTAGEGSTSRRRKSIKSGRGGSILAGSLTPRNIGKRILG